jgi:hypothetical protein
MGESISLEDFENLARLFVGDLLDFPLFAPQFAGVVVGVVSRGEVSAQPHSDGSGGDLGQSGHHDNPRGGVGARQAGGQSEWNSQTIRHSNDDVPNEF